MMPGRIVARWILRPTIKLFVKQPAAHGTPVAQLAVLAMISACRLALVGVCVPNAWLEEPVKPAAVLGRLLTAPNVAPRDQLTALSAGHRESITSARRVIHRFPSGSSRKEHRAGRIRRAALAGCVYPDGFLEGLHAAPRPPGRGAFAF